MRDISKTIDIKAEVRRYYGERVTTGQGCCGDGCCAGTSRTDIGVPSYGCGTPVEHAKLRAGETVIDLGSGPGLDAMLAAREVGPDGEVIGVDMTPAMIETATRNARALDAANVRFVLGDIEALPLPDASADVVLSNCVINLAPDKSRVFREAYRVLKPGGRFVVADILASSELPEALRGDPAAWAACVAGAVSASDYVEGLRAAGFSQVSAARAETDEADEPSAAGADRLPVYAAVIAATKPPASASMIR